MLLGEQTCQVPFLSATYEGSRHDKPIADQTPSPLPKGSELLHDWGVVGFTLEGIEITMPHKKPRGGERSAEQNAENRAIAHRRVRVEHIICSIKRLRNVKDTLRLWKDTVRDLVMEVCVGVHNVRLRLNPWPAYE